MKLTFLKAKSFAMTIITVLLLAGCDYWLQNDETPIRYIHLEEEVPLTEDASSPICDFSIQHHFLNEKNDSIAGLINRSLQRELLGEDYASLAPETAVDSFKNTYIRNYRKEVGEIYHRDPEPVMPWFNRAFELKTALADGREGTLNVEADFYLYEGGAHPNTYSRWMNFDRTTGQLLSSKEVFPAATRHAVEQQLLDALLKTKQAENLDSLKAMGYLTHTFIYIPENFILGKDSISFLFNAYDIAPRAAGATVLKLGYDQLKP